MISLGPESDKLDGAFNFTPWKLKLQMLIEEIDQWSFIENKICTPSQSCSVGRAQ